MAIWPLNAGLVRSSQVVGVVETYKMPARVLAKIRQGQRVVLGMALTGGVLLYLSLFWIIRRASRRRGLCFGKRRRLGRCGRRGRVGSGRPAAIIPAELRKPIDRSVVEFPADTQFERYISNLDSPSAMAFDAPKDTLLIAESGLLECVDAECVLEALAQLEIEAREPAGDDEVVDVEMKRRSA